MAAALAALITTIAYALPATAQPTYPSKPIRFILPNARMANDPALGGVGGRHHRGHRRQLVAEVVGHGEHVVAVCLGAPGEVGPFLGSGGAGCLHAESEAKRKALESELNAKLAKAEDTIAATKKSAMSNVEGIAVDTATAIVQRLIGTAPAAGAVQSAVADALKR